MNKMKFHDLVDLNLIFVTNWSKLYYYLGLGLNFSNILELIKRIGKKKVVLYTVVPAEIKIGVGSNHINDPDKGGLISERFSILQKRCQIIILSPIHLKRRC